MLAFGSSADHLHCVENCHKVGLTINIMQSHLKERSNGDCSRHEIERVISILDRIAVLMDSAVGVPGTRIRVGWDGLLGLLPGVGDLLTSAPLLYFLWIAFRFKMGTKVWIRLLVNQGIDFIVGSIPLIGDIFDVGFKSNRRNANLLIDELERLLPISKS